MAVELLHYQDILQHTAVVRLTNIKKTDFRISTWSFAQKHALARLINLLFTFADVADEPLAWC